MISYQRNSVRSVVRRSGGGRVFSMHLAAWECVRWFRLGLAPQELEALRCGRAMACASPTVNIYYLCSLGTWRRHGRARRPGSGSLSQHVGGERAVRPVRAGERDPRTTRESECVKVKYTDHIYYIRGYGHTRTGIERNKQLCSHHMA